jgi:hypothetical protein
MTASFFYNGSSSSELDYDLANVSEDSIMIAYRPDSKSEWKLHTNMIKQKMVPKDGKGYVIITGIFPGQYAFANYANTSGTAETTSEDNFAFPNPANDKLYATFDDIQDLESLEISMYDINGQKIITSAKSGNNTVIIDVSGLKSGVYILQITDKDHKIIRDQKIIID